MLRRDFNFLENIYSKYSVPFANLFTGPLTFFVILLTELIKSAPCVNMTSQRGQDRASWELVLTQPQEHVASQLQHQLSADRGSV